VAAALFPSSRRGTRKPTSGLHILCDEAHGVQEDVGAFVEHKNQSAKEIIDSLQEQYRFVGSLTMRRCSHAPWLTPRKANPLFFALASTQQVQVHGDEHAGAQTQPEGEAARD